MLVNKDNIEIAYKKFEDSLKKCDMVSFDCEMTGVTYDLKTDATKYDSHEFRYYKYREIVKKFELIQVGITLYTKNEEENEEKNLLNNNDGMVVEVVEVAEAEEEVIQNKKKPSYIERTFNFNLFKNSKLKFLTDLYPNESEMEIFNGISLSHPGSLKFLNDNHFDFNNIISKGINYNKLSLKEKIKELVSYHLDEGKMPNSIVYLSNENEKKLLEAIRQILKFLIYGHEDKKNKTKKYTISGLPHTLVNYLLSTNLKPVFKIKSFGIQKDKTNPDTIIVEKSKQVINTEEFMKEFQSYQNFIENILTMELVFKHRFSQYLLEKEKIDDVVRAELGFSNFIELLASHKKPLIGHNIYFDLLFLYEKFIADLPENFYEFKYNLNQIFPFIYDTKFLFTRLAKEFDNTKLEPIYKNIKKSKYDSYVDIKQDMVNGFCFYHDLEGGNSFHDAGFDSLITGRCFIYLLKGVENYFELDSINKSSKEENKELIKDIKYGYVDFNLRDNLLKEFVNKTWLSLFQGPYGECSFSENNDEYKHREEEIITTAYKNVYIAIYKDRNLTIYEMAKCFSNDSYNISVVKIDDNIAFIEYLTDNHDENRINQINKESGVENVLSYVEFSKSYREIIKIN